MYEIYEKRVYTVLASVIDFLLPKVDVHGFLELPCVCILASLSLNLWLSDEPNIFAIP